MIIEGALSVKAALKHQKRDIHRVCISQNKHSRDIEYIKHLCYKDNIEIILTDKKTIDSMTIGKTHGGIIAEVSHRKYEDPAMIQNGNVLLVEGVEDPYNLGMMLRTCAAAGFKAVITNDRHYQDSEAIILKASAGSSESLIWIRSDDMKIMLLDLHKKGYEVISALRSDTSVPYDEHRYVKDTCLCIGGEKRGLSRDVIESSDGFVHIIYQSDVKVALSAVSATAVIAFEMVRQARDR